MNAGKAVSETAVDRRACEAREQRLTGQQLCEPRRPETNDSGSTEYDANFHC